MNEQTLHEGNVSVARIAGPTYDRTALTGACKDSGSNEQQNFQEKCFLMQAR